MNRPFILLTALGASFATAAHAQAAPAPPPAATATASAPQAIPAKIALIAFEPAVFQTNEGQRTVQEVQKKYEPKKAQIDTLGSEVDSLKKQMQAAPATMTDEDRASRLKAIDIKEKQLNRDAEDANTAYQTDLQEAYNKVAQKVNGVAKQYVAKNGFTLMLDVSNQQSNIMWAADNIDVTQAVINAYNTSSGITAPPPSAPSASRPRPTSTRPAPKPPAK